MGPFRFRLRFDLLPGANFNCPTEELEILSPPGGPNIRLRSGALGTPIKNHSTASFVGGVFSTEDEARLAAERLREALIIWAVDNQFGINLGDGKVRGGVTEAGRAFFEGQLGKPVRNDIPGIDVYPDQGQVVF